MQVYPLTRKKVREVVSADQPGFYRLGNEKNNEFRVAYVGRSDRCLRTRLLKHPRINWYDRFSARCVDTVEQAYISECLHYHMDNGILANKVHPDRPTGMDITCPYCELKEELCELASSCGSVYQNKITN
jgi:hypothetical protein